MTHEEIVMKLIGPINPVGDSSVDGERHNNLISLCYLVEALVYKIDSVSYDNKDRKEASIRNSADYAHKFITETLGIKD